MTKTREIGGYFNETTGGDNKIYSKGNIRNNSHGDIAQNGFEGGISFNNPEKPKTVSKTCYCNRDFTVPELNKIVDAMRATEGLSPAPLFSASNCPLSASEKTYGRFTEEFNRTCKIHNINSCIQKIHFFAQTYWESDKYATTVEYADGSGYNPSERSDAYAMGNTQEGDGPKYKGRGVIQLTWRSAYLAYFKYLISKKSPYVGNKTLGQLITRGSDDAGTLIGKHLELALDASGWYFDVYKRMPRDSPNYNAQFGDQYIDDISKAVNGGGNGLRERNKIYYRLKDVFKITKCINFHKIKNE